MTRLLFFGQAPSRETDGLPPFVGKCGKFLAEQLMGTTQEQLLLRHDFINVLDRWPGAGIGGDKFPLPEAKVAASKLINQMSGRIVVLLGQNVARAFGVQKFNYMQWYEVRNPENLSIVICNRCYIIPHPSQRSRHWNVPKNREMVRNFFKSLLDENLQENTVTNSAEPVGPRSTIL